MKLPTSASRAKKLGRRESEGVLQRAILDAFSHLDYVNAWRNSTGMLRDVNGTPVRFGLCVGSSDIVGVVRCGLSMWFGPVQVPDQLAIGRFFALEVKRRGEKPTDDQLRFLDIVRRQGGAAAWVDNLDAATAFIQRVRDPRWDR